MTLLKNKNIVVIGGTTGLGLSAAKAFIEKGAKVMVVGRNEEIAIQAARSLGNNAAVISADAMDEGTAINAIDQCMEKFGGFDGLYPVAGGSGRKIGDGPLHELSLDGWIKTIALNLTSLMLSNQAAVKAFLANGRGGTILNMGSVLGYSPSPAFFPPMHMRLQRPLSSDLPDLFPLIMQKIIFVEM
ncbi:MAG: SDR family NAD(P)-dependent oxidoreductase [Ferruginibacter sp.]